MIGIWIFALGLMVVPVLPEFIPLYVLFSIALASLVLIRGGLIVARYPLYFVFGLIINSWQLHSLFDSQLPESFDNTWQTLEFKIVSIPQKNPLSTVFIADVRSVQCSDTTCPTLAHQRLRLAWFKPKVLLAPGQVWSARAKLKRPRGLANPQGFDYQAWLLAQNIVATGYVQSGAQLLASEWTWASVRLALSSRITQLADGNEFTRFWTTLIIADSATVTPTDWQTLQATGTIHLVAISGSHIALIILCAFALGGFIARLCGLILSRFAGIVSHRLPPLLSSVFAFIYAGLADFSIPTLRAFLACLAVNACWMLGLRIKPITLLGLGVALVALSEPMAWQSTGFWLSFTAVLLLLHAFSSRPAASPVHTAARLQVVLTLGLSVPLLWLGLGVSWLSPFANVIAEPVISFIIVPGLFVATALSTLSATLAQSTLSGLDSIFGLLWRYLQWLEGVSQPMVWSPKPLSPFVLSLAFLGTLLLLTPRGLRVRGLGVLMIVLSMLVQPPLLPALRLTVMDVGQGLSVVVRTPGRTWIYDTGPAFSDSFDAGSRIVAPYLHGQGVNEVSMMVSHADLDHSGGAESLLTQFKTQVLVVGEGLDLPKFESNSKRFFPAQQPCERGQEWQFDRVSMKVLWPPQASSAKGNRASCVVLLEMPVSERGNTRSVKILLTGDIDREVERQILPLLPNKIDLVIAPHHGSKSSSGQDFVNQTQPRYVVFSAGYKNQFNHPHPIVEARYQSSGATAFNTALSGAVTFQWQEGEESIVETRKAEAKLWYP